MIGPEPDVELISTTLPVCALGEQPVRDVAQSAVCAAESGSDPVARLAEQRPIRVVDTDELPNGLRHGPRVAGTAVRPSAALPDDAESVASEVTMVGHRRFRQFLCSALTMACLSTGAALGSAGAAAAELSDYGWQSRPLLLFAPTADDPRLIETLNRIDSSQCDFVDRDMVIGQIVAVGTSTLDGHVIDAGESQRLAGQYGIGDDTFSAVLIGKDGGEKFRVNGIPDLQVIYAVIDGMPMRSREMNANPGRC